MYVIILCLTLPINLVTNSEDELITKERWKQALERVIAQPEEPILAITFRRGWNSAARPVLVRGIDKNEYVIKGQQAGRQIINDQVVARLGLAIGAPVGKPQLVEISSELIAEDPSFNYLTPGIAHGTLYVPDCFDDRETRKYASQSENRTRFALLSVLYGWVYSGDRQFIYKKARPNLVYSVDHGHFFPGGPNWTVNNLQQAPSAELDRDLVSTCKLAPEEIEQALLALNRVTEDVIIQAVAAPPNEWGLTIDERVTLMAYLFRRKQELLAIL